MKRKYYLRGLGFGILITTLVFMITGQQNMSDERVLARARELGYEKAAPAEPTSSVHLSELKATLTPAPTQEAVTPALTPTAMPVPTKALEPTSIPVPTKALEPTSTPVPTKALEPTSTPVPTKALEPTATPEPDDSVTATITVTRGMTSRQVCRLLEDAGIITSWVEMNQYMIDHGLADYINIGTFSLSNAMTRGEIAYLLTGRQAE